jgi:hypothetical protein
VKSIRQAALVAVVSGGMLLGQSTPQPSTEMDKHPGFHDEIPNKAMSGDRPATNSTLQKDRAGDMGSEYLGWIGLVGLAGLFGLSRGTNSAPDRARRNKPEALDSTGL